MLLIVLGFVLFIAGASQMYSSPKSRNVISPSITIGKTTTDDESRWLRKVYGKNLMRAGSLLALAGSTLLLLQSS